LDADSAGAIAGLSRRGRAVFYVVEEGVVTLCEENGKPTGKTMRLGEGDEPRRIAAMLKRSTMEQSDFNRAIHYGPSGIS
jgi:hypothetical protein